jgi:hypothetical protein
LTDGSGSSSVLIIPVINEKPNLKFVVFLHGRKTISIFTQEDEILLTTPASFFALALRNSERFSDAPHDIFSDGTSTQFAQ